MKLKHCLFMHTEAGSSDDWSKLLSSDPRNRFLSRLINPVILIGWKQAFDMIYIVKVKQMWVVKVLSSMLKFFPGHSPIDLPGKAPRLLQYKGAIPPYLPLVNVPHMIAFRNLFPPPYFFSSFFKFSGKPWVRCACSLMWWQLIDNSCVSLGKQLMFWNAITDFPAKWWLNLHTVVCYYLDLGSASDWWCFEGKLLQPIRSFTQMWAVTGHQYEISCSHSPDIMSQGNQWWHRKMSAVFSGFDFFKRNNYLLQDLEGEREVNKDEVLEYCNSSDVNIPLIETSAKVGRVVFPVWTVQYRVFLEKTI